MKVFSFILLLVFTLAENLPAPTHRVISGERTRTRYSDQGKWVTDWQPETVSIIIQSTNDLQMTYMVKQDPSGPHGLHWQIDQRGFLYNQFNGFFYLTNWIEVDVGFITRNGSMIGGTNVIPHNPEYFEQDGVPFSEGKVVTESGHSKTVLENTALLEVDNSLGDARWNIEMFFTCRTKNGSVPGIKLVESVAANQVRYIRPSLKAATQGAGTKVHYMILEKIQYRRALIDYPEYLEVAGIVENDIVETEEKVQRKSKKKSKDKKKKKSKKRKKGKK